MIRQQPLTPKSPTITISKLKTYETHRNSQTLKFAGKNSKRRSTHNQKNIFKLTNSTKTLPVSHAAKQFESIITQKRNYQQMIKTELKRLDQFESMDNQQLQLQEFQGNQHIINSEFETQEHHEINESTSPLPKQILYTKDDTKWDWQQNLAINNSKSQAVEQLICQMKKKSFYDKLADNLQANTKIRASTYFYSKNLSSTCFSQWKQLTKENDIDTLNEHVEKKSLQLHRLLLIHSLNQLHKLSKDKRTRKRGTILELMIAYRRSKATLRNLHEIHLRIKDIRAKNSQITSYLKASNLKWILKKCQSNRNIQNKTLRLLNIRLHQSFKHLYQDMTTKKQISCLRHYIQHSKDPENQRSLFEPKQLTSARSLLLAEKSVRQSLKAQRFREVFKLLTFQYKLERLLHSDSSPKSTISMMHRLIKNLKANQIINKKQRAVCQHIFTPKYLNQFFVNLKNDRRIQQSIQQCKDKIHEANNCLFNAHDPTIKYKSRFGKTKRRFVLKLFFSLLHEECQVNKKLRLTGQVLGILHSQNLKKMSFNILKYHQRADSEMELEGKSHEYEMNLQSSQNASKQCHQIINEKSFEPIEKNDGKQIILDQSKNSQDSINDEIQNQEVETYLLQKSCTIMLTNLKSMNQINKKRKVVRNHYQKYLIIRSIIKLKQNAKAQAQVMAQSLELSHFLRDKQSSVICRKLKHNARLQGQKKEILQNMSQQNVESTLNNPYLDLYSLKQEMVFKLLIGKRGKELMSLLAAHKFINKNSITITKIYLQNCLNLMTNSARHKKQARELLDKKKNEICSYIHRRQLSQFIAIKECHPHEEQGRKFLIANKQYRRKVVQLREIRCRKSKHRALAKLRINYQNKLNKKMLELSTMVISLFNRSSSRIFCDFVTLYKKETHQDQNQHMELHLTELENNTFQPSNILKDNHPKSPDSLVDQQYSVDELVDHIDDLPIKQQTEEENKRRQESLEMLQQSGQYNKTQSKGQAKQQSKSFSNGDTDMMQNREDQIMQEQLEQWNRRKDRIKNSQQQSEQWKNSVSNEGSQVQNNSNMSSSCRFEEIAENDESVIENQQYFNNRYNMSIINKTFNILKSNTKSHQAMNENCGLDSPPQENLIRKCWQGLRMFSRQKSLVKKYLQEFENLETYSYFPSSKEQLQKFKQIQANTY